VAVIGAGFAGMSAALRLAEAGVRVRVLEASLYLGGRASSFRHRESGLELDRGPHLFMAANPALRSFLDRIGATPFIEFTPALDLTYRLANPDAPEGFRQEQLAFSPRGGSLASLAALLRWRGPRLRARLGIARGLLRILSSGEEEKGAVAGMLDRLGQNEDARAWFWEPFARAVLNLPADRGSAALFAQVIREAFGAGPRGAALGTPLLPLSLFWAERAAGRIRDLGGEVLRATSVHRIALEGGRVRGVVLSGGETFEAAAAISAVPPPALLALLPEDLRQESPWREVGRLRPSPIASAYLWLDRPSAGPAYEALMGAPWQWLFRPAAPPGEGSRLVALLAGGEDSIASGSRAALAASARETSARVFPGSRVSRVVVVRERAATWANGAEEQPWRPGAETPLAGLFLAGDWTATGLPATVEGAVRSGERAAEAALRPGERISPPAGVPEPGQAPPARR